MLTYTAGARYATIKEEINQKWYKINSRHYTNRKHKIVPHIFLL